MKIEIKPTEKPEKLKESLEKRADTVRVEEGKVIAELDDRETVERLPGVEKYKAENEEYEGLKGRPIQEQAYAKINSKEDLAKAFLATIDGYDLRILESVDEWDLRLLKRFNPDIKELDSDEPVEILDIDKALFPVEGLEEVEIDISSEDVDMVIDYMMH